MLVDVPEVSTLHIERLWLLVKSPHARAVDNLERLLGRTIQEEFQGTSDAGPLVHGDLQAAGKGYGNLASAVVEEGRRMPAPDANGQHVVRVHGVGASHPGLRGTVLRCELYLERGAQLLRQVAKVLLGAMARRQQQEHAHVAIDAGVRPHLHALARAVQEGSGDANPRASALHLLCGHFCLLHFVCLQGGRNGLALVLRHVRRPQLQHVVVNMPALVPAIAAGRLCNAVQDRLAILRHCGCHAALPGWIQTICQVRARELLHSTELRHIVRLRIPGNSLGRRAQCACKSRLQEAPEHLLTRGLH
mmetsp:Transcript_64534/g.178946  ORF Transcript_64534/g.178946 Transcript_64534/m.178946 type:complete len:305 (-) Transcript_64534:408-1322(-)